MHSVRPPLRIVRGRSIAGGRRRSRSPYAIDHLFPPMYFVSFPACGQSPWRRRLLFISHNGFISPNSFISHNGCPVKYAAIGPISIHLPEKVETNEQLKAQHPEWDMDLIHAKTGIAARHIADPTECSS